MSDVFVLRGSLDKTKSGSAILAVASTEALADEAANKFLNGTWERVDVLRIELDAITNELRAQHLANNQRPQAQFENAPEFFSAMAREVPPDADA